MTGHRHDDVAAMDLNMNMDLNIVKKTDFAFSKQFLA